MSATGSKAGASARPRPGAHRATRRDRAGSRRTNLDSADPARPITDADAADGGTASRAIWGVVSQGVSSLAMLGLGVGVSREVDVATFSLFGLGMTFLIVGFACGQKLLGSLVLTGSGRGDFDRLSFERAAMTVCLGLAVLTGAVIAVIGVMARGEARELLLTLAVGAAVFLYRDGHKMRCFADGRAHTAALADLVFLFTAVALIAAGHLVGDPALNTVRGWGLGVLASLLVLWVSGAPPRSISPRLAGAFVARNAPHLPPLAVDLAVTLILTQSLALLLPLIGKVEEVGGIRGVYLLFGPYNVVVGGLTPIALVELSRRRQTEYSVLRFAIGWWLGIATLTALLVATLLLIPDSWGDEILGATWPHARALVAPVGVDAAIISGATGVALLYQSRRSFGASARLGIATALPAAVVAMLVAAMSDAQVGLWARAAVTAIGTVYTVHMFFRLRREVRDSAATPLTT